MKTKQDPSLKWSIQKQFITYILASTLFVMVFTFGLAMLLQSIHSQRTSSAELSLLNDLSVQLSAESGERILTEEDAIVLTPPIKNPFTAPTLVVTEKGVSVTAQQNPALVKWITGFKQTLLMDYQRYFLWGFTCLILIQFFLSYYLIKFKFVQPVHEAFHDLEQLVEGTYALSEKKASANELLQLHHLIYKLSQALEAAACEKALADQQRKTLIAGISHDLKTPLTNISGYAETLLMESGTPAEQADYLEIILRNSNLVNQMINNISMVNQYGKTESQMTLQNLDLLQVLSECKLDFSEAAKCNNQKIDIVSEGNRPIITDQALIRRLFINLFQNFIQHAGQGSVLSIACTANQNAVCINFDDNGIGVPKPLVSRLTDLMFTVDEARSHRLNSGIGLYNVLQITSLLEGQLEVESDKGQGMHIKIILPLSIDSKEAINPLY